MKTITATNARSNWYQLLKKTIKSQLPMRISSKEGTAIIMSEEEYESLLETAELLSIKGFKESIKKADKEIAANDLFSIEEILK